jgi:UDP-glucose 4-epimerase
MKLKHRRMLVTGGAGFIGSHLVEALIQVGCNVRVIDNLSTGSLSNLSKVEGQVEFFLGDIRDRKLLREVAAGCDVIFHQAAIVSVLQTVEKPIESTAVNELGTLEILEAARFNHVKRVVIASTSAVYGNDPRLPKHETLPLSPESPYAVQKLNGEQYARLYSKLYGVETICLRYFNVYGPRQDPNSPYSGVISIFLSKAAVNATSMIYGDGRQSRDFIFVTDVVKANLLASNSNGANGECVNVGTGRSTTIIGLWELICKISGCRQNPRHTEARPGDIIASVAGTDHASSVLGFTPDYSFEEGLEITYNWYKKMLKCEDSRISS